MTESYSEAALRHKADADVLAAELRFDGAGYLVGLAAECAIKHAIGALRPTIDKPHLHLPKLIESAKKIIQGRRKASIFTVLERANYMKGWTIDVRYAGDGAVTADQFEAWKQDVVRTLAAASLRRASA